MIPSIHTISTRLLVVVLVFALSFCTKSGSDPSPNPPQQSALISPSDAKSVGAALIMPTGTETKTGTPPASSTNTQAPKAAAPTTQVSSTTGSTTSLEINYSNLNGAVGGVYAQIQGAPTYFSIPLQGTAPASGKITIPVGIPVNLDNGSFTIVISVYDASGRVSNTVSITITIGATLPPVVTNDDPYKDGDPYAKDYFIDYYENGDFHSLNYTTSPVSFTYQGGYPSTGSFFGCKRSNLSSASTYIPCAGSGECDKFSLSFSRDGWDKVPKVGSYEFLQGSEPYTGVNLTINGASNCTLGDKKDAYIKLTIDEVKVVKDYGPAKSGPVVKVGQDIRGYFSGTFEAVLYASSTQEQALGIYRRSVIANGRFKLPMGGENVKLNGTGTVIKNPTTLTINDKIYPAYVDCNYGVRGNNLTVFRLETYTDPHFIVDLVGLKNGTTQLYDETKSVNPINSGRPYVMILDDAAATGVLGLYSTSGSVKYDGSTFSGSGTFAPFYLDKKITPLKVSFTGACK